MKIQFFTCWRFNEKNNWVLNFFRITYNSENHGLQRNKSLSIIILNFGILIEKIRKEFEMDLAKEPDNKTWEIGNYKVKNV